MLHSLSLKNVKGFAGGHELQLAPITLLYGPNSAGKSTLLQALMLLKQTFEDTDPQQPALVVRGNIVDLGSVPGIINDHDTTKELGLGLQFEPGRRRPVRADVRPLPDKLDLRFKWDAAAQSVRQTSVSYFVEDRSVASFTRRKGPDRLTRQGRASDFVFRLGKREAREAFVDWLSEAAIEQVNRQQRIQKRRQVDGDALRSRLIDASYAAAGHGLLPLFTNFRESKSQTRDEHTQLVLGALGRRWQNVSNDFRWSLGDVLEEIAYLGPLRHAPQRFHLLSGAKRSNVGSSGEYAAEVLSSNSALLARANRWLELFDIPYILDVKRVDNPSVTQALGDVLVTTLQDRRTNTVVGVGDVGFGISQLLPIIVQSLTRTRSTVCIEQPEIHLHPRLQAHLADLFIEATSVRGVQVIAETHSEHLMLRLQRRIREGTISPRNVSIAYIDHDGEGGSEIVPIPIADDGTFLRDWPSGFFPERLYEKFGSTLDGHDA